VQHCNLLHGTLYVHSDIFLTDVTGYDGQKFT